MLYHPSYSDSATPKDRDLYADVLQFSMNFMDHVQRIHDAGEKCEIEGECHTIVRCISHFLPDLKVIDGNYLGFVQRRGRKKKTLSVTHCPHSWLITPDATIIDAYPVGAFCCHPMLVYSKGKYSSFGAGHYVPDPEVMTPRLVRKVARQTEAFIRLASEMRA